MTRLRLQMQPGLYRKLLVAPLVQLDRFPNNRQTRGKDSMTEEEAILQVGELVSQYYDDEHYSCAEAMVKAFAQVFTPHRYHPDLIPRIATPFNGGIAELKQVCGVLTAGLMVIGMVAGRDQPGDEDAKEEAYTLAQIFHKRFMTAVATDSCQELLRRWQDQGVSKIHCKRHTREISEMLARTILQVGFHELELEDE